MTSGQWDKHSDGSVKCFALTGCQTGPLADRMAGLVRLEFLANPGSDSVSSLQLMIRTPDLTRLIDELQNLESQFQQNHLAAAKPTGIPS
jgi:hypothetical protein